MGPQFMKFLICYLSRLLLLLTPVYPSILLSILLSNTTSLFFSFASDQVSRSYESIGEIWNKFQRNKGPITCLKVSHFKLFWANTICNVSLHKHQRELWWNSDFQLTCEEFCRVSNPTLCMSVFCILDTNLVVRHHC